MRYAIRPLGRMEIKYKDPHSSAPDPDHIFPLVFAALTEDLAGTKDSRSREYPDKKAKELFNADWAAAAIFDLDKVVSSRYRTGFLLAVHKSKKADAFTLFLFDDPEAAKPFLDKAKTSLRFKNHQE